MKKKILMIALLLGLTIPGWSSAEVVGISEQQWNQASDDYWFNQKCDEIRNQEVYAGQM